MATCGTMQSPLPDAPTPQQIHRDSDKPPVPEKETSLKNKKGKRTATKKSLNKKRLLTMASVVVIAVVVIIISHIGSVSYRSGNVKVKGDVTVGKLKKAEQLMTENECDSLWIYDNTRFDADAMEYLGTMTGLRHLGLYLQDNSYNKEIDLSPLSNLTYQLKGLTLCCNKISGICPLSYLRNLEYLSLCCKNDFDLYGLSDLTNLTYLSLSGCESVSDLRQLSGLTNLTNLSLNRCKSISDLRPLSGLVNLTRLSLNECECVSNIEPLSGLTNLTDLSLEGCKSISDLRPLSGLTNLTSLSLSNCDHVTDLTSLAGLTDMRLLYISKTNVTSLNGVENMVKLSVLQAKGCKLHDTSALEVSGRRNALQQ